MGKRVKINNHAQNSVNSSCRKQCRAKKEQRQHDGVHYRFVNNFIREN